MEGTVLLDRFITYIIDPAMLLLFTAGFLVFVWGIFEMILGLAQGKGYSEGVQHIIWGLVGMLIMVSVNGIMALIINTFELDPANPDVSRIQDVNPGANFFGR